MTVKKRSVNTVKWPSDEDAKSRIDALRLRDKEIGELVRGHDAIARIAELEKQVRYLRRLSVVERAKNPWWLLMQVKYVIGAVVKRYLKR